MLTNVERNIKDEIWLLLDDRAGTASQAINLSDNLPLQSQKFTLKYSIFAKLPNFIPIPALWRLDKNSRDKFCDLNYFPKIILSSGRRSANIALYLKRKSKSQSKIIQIMNPKLCFGKFDLIILPKHDQIKEENFSNVITTIGSLTKSVVDKKSKQDETSKTIAVLVGGSSKSTKFSTESAAKLGERISQIANQMSANLRILNSRRTSQKISQELISKLNCNFEFFDWDKVKNNNPYQEILESSNFFIITGDSVSMISEACSTGKSVYIFDEENISSKKHRLFHQNLYEQNYARRFIDTITTLENFSPKKLEETKRVSLQVIERLFQSNKHIG